MGTLWQEIKHALRTLGRNPGFTAAVVLILAAGVRMDAGAPATTQAPLPGGSSPADSNQAPLDEGPASKVGPSAPEEKSAGRLVAWWKLDEVEGNVAADSSGHGFAGRLTGNPRWQSTAGRVKGALAFDGAEGFVEIQDQPAFGLTGAITVAAWIKVNSFTKRWQTIMAKGDTAWRLQRTADEDTLAFHCTGLSSERGQWAEGIEGRKNVNDGQWHHVAGVYDGAVVSLYIDGALDNSSRVAGAIQTNHFPVSIGANAEVSGRSWHGLIDEVCVFASALNAGGVSALYSGQDPAVIAGQASAMVSAEEVAAELRARQVNDANALALEPNVIPPDAEKGRKWPLALMILAGAALAAGVYTVQRRRGGL